MGYNERFSYDTGPINKMGPPNSGIGPLKKWANLFKK
jgi:hypothetical protein